MNDEYFEIVDETGTTHQFPVGMDPKKAAEIVRKQTAREPAPALQPHQLHVPADAKISASAPYSGFAPGDLDRFQPVPSGLNLQGATGAVRAASTPLIDKISPSVGRLLTHVAKNYVPNVAKPLRGALNDAGSFLQNVPAGRAAVGSSLQGAEGAAGSALGDAPRIKLATQELPNLDQIRLFLRAQGHSPERIEQIIKEHAADLALRAPRNY